MVEKIREVYERYGFEPVETPAIEYTDALGKFLPDQDRPNEGVFSFQDDDEQWISLRYDLTAPLARYVAENFDSLPKPYRSYRVGYVYRNEKPGPGRFRQFMQFDADTVGSASPAADAEMCMMAADTMEALGIPRGSYVVKVNNRKVLDGVMESDRARRRRECGSQAHGAASDRQAGSTWASRACASCSARAAKMKAAISPRERSCRNADFKIETCRECSRECATSAACICGQRGNRKGSLAIPTVRKRYSIALKIRDRLRTAFHDSNSRWRVWMNWSRSRALSMPQVMEPDRID